MKDIRWFWMERSLLTMKFMWRFYWIHKRKVYLAKMNTHHGAGPKGAGPNAAASVASAWGRIWSWFESPTPTKSK